jgi:hypothetical protein
VVSPLGSDESGDGSAERPLRTVQAAADRVAADKRDTIIYLEKGEYEAGAHLPDALAARVSFVGRGAPGDVVVHGGLGATAIVFSGGASYVSWRNLTLSPSPGSTGDFYGFAIFVATHDNAFSIRDVVVDGMGHGGVAVQFMGYSTLTLGPRVDLSGSTSGISLDNMVQLTIVGTTAQPTRIHDTTKECIYLYNQGLHVGVRGDDGDVATTPVLLLDRCGRDWAIGVDYNSGPTMEKVLELDRTEITGGTSYGISAMGPGGIVVRHTKISGVTSWGLLAGGADVAVSDSQLVRNGGGVNVGAGAVTLRNTVVRDNGGDGVLCSSGSIAVAYSELVRNGYSGLHLTNNCVIDTIAGGLDHVVLNRNNDADRNFKSGLCYEAMGSGIDVGGATWSCDRTAAGCGPGAPTRSDAPGCADGVDISAAPPLAVTSGAAICCR